MLLQSIAELLYRQATKPENCSISVFFVVSFSKATAIMTEVITIILT